MLNQIGAELAYKINYLTGFFYLKLLACPPHRKTPKCFMDLTP